MNMIVNAKTWKLIRKAARLKKVSASSFLLVLITRWSKQTIIPNNLKKGKQQNVNVSIPKGCDHIPPEIRLLCQGNRLNRRELVESAWRWHKLGKKEEK